MSGVHDDVHDEHRRCTEGDRAWVTVADAASVVDNAFSKRPIR
jgi:hypothetical protein